MIICSDYGLKCINLSHIHLYLTMQHVLSPQYVVISENIV